MLYWLSYCGHGYAMLETPGPNPITKFQHKFTICWILDTLIVWKWSHDLKLPIRMLKFQQKVTWGWQLFIGPEHSAWIVTRREIAGELQVLQAWIQKLMLLRGEWKIRFRFLEYVHQYSCTVTVDKESFFFLFRYISLCPIVLTGTP